MPPPPQLILAGQLRPLPPQWSLPWKRLQYKSCAGLASEQVCINVAEQVCINVAKQ